MACTLQEACDHGMGQCGIRLRAGVYGGEACKKRGAAGRPGPVGAESGFVPELKSYAVEAPQYGQKDYSGLEMVMDHIEKGPVDMELLRQAVISRRDMKT